MNEALLHIVYLRNGPMLLTKKQYGTWREIQDEFADYMASLGPWLVSDVLEFLRDEYPGDFTNESSAVITRFLVSDAVTLTLFDKDKLG